MSDGVTEVAIQATPLLGLNIPYGLQYHAKFFVSCAIRDPLDYNVCKVRMKMDMYNIIIVCVYSYMYVFCIIHAYCNWPVIIYTVCTCINKKTKYMYIVPLWRKFKNT